MVSLTSGLTGLTLLSGSDAFSALSSAMSTTIESKAVRDAKAAFTTPVTTPPWREAASTTPQSIQVSMIKAMATIIDKPKTGADALPTDVQTAFTTYKALDRLRLLAHSAAASTSSDAQRADLDKSFQKGLADLQSYLADAPTDLLKLSFAKTARREESVVIPKAIVGATVGQGLVSTRTDAVPGLAGNEVFRLNLSKTGGSDVVTVDLSQGQQPPTVDSVTTMLNAAIATVPMRDTGGNIVYNTDGTPMKRYASTFAVQKITTPPEKAGEAPTTKWAISMTGAGSERVAIDQIGGKDALVVATGQTALDAPASVKMIRFDDPTGTMSQTALGTINSIDSEATERAAMNPPAKNLAGVTPAATTIYAQTSSQAVATDAQGYSYVVGTAAGDMGSNLSGTGTDLFLTKMDSQGKVVWQRTVGAAGSATGAAVSIGADGSIVVAGTVSGKLDGTDHSDPDMLVSKFDTNGDEQFTTVIRNYADDQANAVAVGSDGSIYVGGKTGAGSGNAFVARLDSTGKVQERRTIDYGGSEKIVGLAMAGDGNLLALTNENGTAKVRSLDAHALATDLGSVDLGTADARAIAVDSDGSIAVGGARSVSGSRDGFVARIDSGLSSAQFTALSTTGDDQVDSLAFMNGQLYAGGRTTGDLGGPHKGPTDGFIARIDDSTGAVGAISQFGQTALKTEPVRIAASVGGNSATAALGLPRGTINPTVSTKLVAQTSLRAGDEFSVKGNDGTAKKITIAADETLQTLADKVKKALGAKVAKVTTPLSGGGNVLRIDAVAGNSIELIPGADGKDALAKLGMDPQRIYTPPTPGSHDPKVKPGGSYGLNLTEALSLGTAADAAKALDMVGQAISTTQSGYRSLYWDDLKAKMAEGGKINTATGASSTYYKSQLSNYQAALDRLQSGPSPTLGF